TLEEIDEARQHALDVSGGTTIQESGHRVHDDHTGLEVLNPLVHAYQMHLETVRRGPRPVILKEARLRPGGQVTAHRTHIARRRAERFLEGEEQAALTGGTRSVDKLCR